jgi:hypothetical protein
LSGFDPIAILPLVFLVLNVIQVTKDIRPSHFIKIAEPGQILRLVNSSDQKR